MSAAQSGIVIERLNIENAALLDSVAPGVFDYAIDPVQVASFVGDARHLLYMAVDDSTVVGMVSGLEYFHPDKPPQMWLNEIGVAPAYRRRGIGRLLVEALLAEARSRGCTTAWLGTDLDNAAAQACFASAAGQRAKQPFLLYEWDLPG